MALPARVLIMALAALLAQWPAPYHPLDIDNAAIFQRPGRNHWLGTASIGRDVLSAVLWIAPLIAVIPGVGSL